MKVRSTGMVFDRALSPPLLDLALHVATKTRGSPDARRILTVALRDHMSDQEAEGKTKKVLSRIWVEPPAECQAMIDWAIDNQHQDPTHTILHYGAMLSTFPFVGAVAALAGRELRLEGHIEPFRVRANARAMLGDRSTIDIGARKVLTTFRYLGLVDREARGLLRVCNKTTVPPNLLGWLTHALLLTRSADSVGVTEVSSAPEFATIEMPSWTTTSYPLLEVHTEASRMVVAARNCVMDRGTPT
jgi:hypothetical protein